MNIKHIGFDEHEVLHQLKHYLPTQTPLKDFIHHNSLHAFQDKNFYEAIFKAASVFGFEATLPLRDFRQLHQTGRITHTALERAVEQRYGKGSFSDWKAPLFEISFDTPFQPKIGQLRARWKERYQIDLDGLVYPLLFRILSSYLDQGVALAQFPFEADGLLNAIRAFERGSYTSFFKSKRAKQLLLDADTDLSTLLNIVVGEKAYYEQYLFDQQFGHRGWSGMVAVIEEQPQAVLAAKQISLQELIQVELLFEIDALETSLGRNWKPLCEGHDVPPPLDLLADTLITEHQAVLAIWQDAFEWSYYDDVLSGLQAAQQRRATSTVAAEKAFQAIFCIDERECSLRRYTELLEPAAETLGCPGFFGVEFYFQPQHAKFYEKLCPLPVTPKHLIKEGKAKRKKKRDLFQATFTHSVAGGLLSSLAIGHFAALKSFRDILFPGKHHHLASTFDQMYFESELLIENTSLDAVENGLQLGYTVAEMTTRVAGLLKNIGLTQGFAPLVYLVAHGSTTINNPYHRAYDCGACSGRNGSVNARVFAFMGNHPQVRAELLAMGIEIPETTQFVGALHDTTADEMAFYDEGRLSVINKSLHKKHKGTFEAALDLNAKERSRRFASIDTTAHLKKVRRQVRKRSVSFFEPRPELGHGTNALCFVGHRSLTKHLFLDRRAFMNSYDYRNDPTGELLLGVMRPLPPVCGGINLEYYFSRVDNYKLGAGTKLPHNVVGLIGVANSSDGDLRPGLPLQMIEVHDPVRLLMLVEHYPEVVLATIKKEDSLYEWFINGWVHLVAIHPETGRFYYFQNGAFGLYEPTQRQVASMSDVTQYIEQAKEMKTNHIVEATQENIPVHVLDV
jgi:uncharacterized protein